MGNQINLDDIIFRQPVDTDGMAVWKLVRSCPPLDENSSYCNILQCSHFARTSIAAQWHDEIIGFISGYYLPQEPTTLFVWQVAVARQARGLGLGRRMLTQLVARCIPGPRFVETTITTDNKASWALFESFAKHQNTDIRSTPWLDREKHFCGEHASENLIRIGPFN